MCLIFLFGTLCAIFSWKLVEHEANFKMSFEDGPVSLFSSLDSMVENAFDGLEQAFENSENAENVDKKNETNVTSAVQCC